MLIHSFSGVDAINDRHSLDFRMARPHLQDGGSQPAAEYISSSASSTKRCNSPSVEHVDCEDASEGSE